MQKPFGREFFQAIAEECDGLIAVIDPSGAVLYRGPAFERVLGWRADEHLSLRSPLPIHRDDLAALSESVDRVLGARRAPVAVSFRVRHSDGSWRTVEGTLRNRVHETGVRGLLLSLHDVTERRAAEAELENHRHRLADLVQERTRELEQSRAALEQSKRLAAMGTLAAGMAHQLNNPLGGILLAAEAALLEARRQRELPEPYVRTLEEIAGEAERCGRIVRSLLKFSRNESVEKWVADLRDVVECSADATRSYAEQHAVKLRVESGLEPLPARMNPIEVEQVLVNLVQNAVEAGSEGSSVTVRATSLSAHHRVEVSDDGRGIEPELLERVFEPYFTTRLSHGGTGLGLSLAHRIAVDHGGDLSIDSTPGYGTTATLSLPRA